MANEVTTTSLTELVNSEAISPALQEYSRPWLVATRFCKPYDLRGRGSATIAVARLETQMGAVSDGGTSIDTEFNVSEGSDLSNTAMTAAEATITTGEQGVLRTVTDTALEDTIDGLMLLQLAAQDSARILATALEDDVCALFSGLSNTSGTTTVNLTLANLDDAIAGIFARGVRAPDGLVGILDDQQKADFEAAVTASNSSTAVYDSTADRFMQIERDENNGLTDGRFGRYKGINLYATGLTDTANAGADVVGAIFVPETPANTMNACFGIAWSRMPTMTTERDESLRATEVVVTQRVGVGELNDDCGQGIVTDAP